MGAMGRIAAVVMDSPLHAIARYERDHGIEHNAINRAIVAAGDSGAWSRLERGELELEAFFEPFEADLARAGLEVDAPRVFEYIAEASAPRPRMIEAIARIRSRQLRVGALTNNWRRDDEPNPLLDHFDVFIESSVVGLRKPDPRIYELTCRELDVPPPRAAFLDDIGRNL